MTDVIYIAGAPRSGTTILSQLLGEVQGIFNAGEVRFLWRQIFDDWLCGCGLPLRQCEHWAFAVDASAGLSSKGTRTLLRQAAAEHSYIRTLPWQLLTRAVTGRLPEGIAQHLTATAPMYRAASTRASATAVVDSSKSPSYAHALSTRDDIRLHVVHLIRDPHAVVHSWLRGPGRTRRRTQRLAGTTYAALKWTAWNLGIELALRTRTATYTRLRYEDLVGLPAESLASITSATCGGGRSLPVRDGDHVAELHVNHTIYGNGHRFRAGSVPITDDDEWRRVMRPGARAAVTALTWPLLARYGYLGQRAQRS